MGCKDVGVLGGALHDPHLPRLAALHGHLRRRRVLLRRCVRPHGRHARRQAHLPSGSKPLAASPKLIVHRCWGLRDWPARLRQPEGDKLPSFHGAYRRDQCFGRARSAFYSCRHHTDREGMGGGDLHRASTGVADQDQLGDPEDRPDLQAARPGPVGIHHQLRIRAGLRDRLSAVERRLGVAAVLALRLRVQRRARSERRQAAAEKGYDRGGVAVVGGCSAGRRGGAEARPGRAELEGESDESALDHTLLGVLGCVHEAGGDAPWGCPCLPLLLRPKLRHADDCDSGLEGHPCVRDQPGAGVQRHHRDRSDPAVPGRALVGVHASGRAMVHLDAVVLPAGVRRLHLGGRRRRVGVDAHGRRRRVPPRPLDVRSGGHAAHAGRSLGLGPVRGRRGPELATVHVRPAYLHHGHRHLRPQGFQRADRALLLPGDLRRGHVHAACVPGEEAPVPPGQDLRQDELDQTFLI